MASQNNVNYFRGGGKRSQWGHGDGKGQLLKEKGGKEEGERCLIQRRALLAQCGEGEACDGALSLTRKS